MLGTDLSKAVTDRGHELLAPARDELDIANPDSVGCLAVGEFGSIDVCINCAAYTAVDKAEQEARQATELNQIAPGYLANACAVLGARLIHISTDFVFDGTASTPYDEDAPTHPLGIYGKTKRGGELAVLSGLGDSLVVRTAWLYGANGNSFPKTMIKAWLAGKDLRVVSDQIGCPTYTVDLARVVLDLVEKKAYPGIYHAVGPDSMNWRDFAVEAIGAYAKKHGLSNPIEVAPIRSEDWPTPAKRPAYSVLSTAKIQGLGIAPMRPVSGSLADFVSLLDL
jgi:dTDP-4-dehydrorhamnose reductase